MSVSSIPVLTQDHIWQLLEFVANPSAQVNRKLLTDALDKVINGSPDDREEGIEAIHAEMARHLPALDSSLPRQR